LRHAKLDCLLVKFSELVGSGDVFRLCFAIVVEIRRVVVGSSIVYVAKVVYNFFVNLFLEFDLFFSVVNAVFIGTTRTRLVNLSCIFAQRKYIFDSLFDHCTFQRLQPKNEFHKAFKLFLRVGHYIFKPEEVYWFIRGSGQFKPVIVPLVVSNNTVPLEPLPENPHWIFSQLLWSSCNVGLGENEIKERWCYVHGVSRANDGNL